MSLNNEIHSHAETTEPAYYVSFRCYRPLIYRSNNIGAMRIRNDIKGVAACYVTAEPYTYRPYLLIPVDTLSRMQKGRLGVNGNSNYAKNNYVFHSYLQKIGNRLLSDVKENRHIRLQYAFSFINPCRQKFILCQHRSYKTVMISTLFTDARG